MRGLRHLPLVHALAFPLQSQTQKHRVGNKQPEYWGRTPECVVVDRNESFVFSVSLSVHNHFFSCFFFAPLFSTASFLSLRPSLIPPFHHFRK